MNKDDYYYLLPFYKKAYYNVLDFLKQIKHIKISWKKIIIFVATLLILLLIFILVMNQKKPFPLRSAYNKENFVEAKDVDDDAKYRMENSNFLFEMNKSSSFILTDKRNNAVYLSDEPDAKLTSSRNLFNITYMKTIGGQVQMTGYDKSVKNLDYSFRLTNTNNSITQVEVLYKYGGKKGVIIDDVKYDVEDFPKALSIENFEMIINNLTELMNNAETSADRRRFSRYISQIEEIVYKLDTNNQDRYIRDDGKLSTDRMKEDMAYAFYIYGGYTNEKLREDNSKFGYETTTEYPYFEFSVQYRLTEKGFEFELINDSIVESESFPLLSIDILPNFGSGKLNDNGFVLIPDGSGALINFDNNKYSSSYSKRVYGLDYAMSYNLDYQIEKVEAISMPMYGIQKNGYSFINVIEQGASMCELNAGFKSIVSGTELTNKLVTSNFKYYLREIDNYYLGSSSSKINIWDDTYNDENLLMQYILLKDDDANYSDMANTYREYLKENGFLIDSDNTTEANLNITILGSYLEKKYFLGLPYNHSTSLTTADQAKEIINNLLAEEVKNINLVYKGFANDGLKPYYMDKIDFEKSTASKKQLQQLEEYLLSQNIDLYLDIYGLTAFTDKNISTKENSIYNLIRKKIVRYPFSPASFFPDKTLTEFYSLNSKTLNNLLKGLNKDLYNNGFKNVSYIDLGNELNSNFKRNETTYRIKTQEDIVNYLSKSENKFNQIFRNPNVYVLPYAKFVLDLPNTGTNYPVIDTLIPFVQLVLSGSIDYSGQQINLDDKYSYEWHKLKAIETGSNLSFTWSYKDTVELVETEYNQYYSTYYKNSFEEAVSLYKELNNLGIYKGSVVRHEIISNPDIVKVTYSNGLVFEIDYRTLTYKKIAGGNN